MAITKEDILEAVGSLTVMELNDLVKAFEEKFGVSAAAVLLLAVLLVVLLNKLSSL
jgi:large subunit ribosomal protein L7/L12